MTKKSPITIERLKEVLDYDPNSGIFTWRVSVSNVRAGNVAGSIEPNGYVRIEIDRRGYRAHVLAWLYMTGKWPHEQIDHINTEKADNRFCNFREATKAQNIANSKRRSDNTSGRKGVSWHRKSKKWVAWICVDGKSIYLGIFAKLDDAAQAYGEAAEKHFGEFARWWH